MLPCLCLADPATLRASNCVLKSLFSLTCYPVMLKKTLFLILYLYLIIIVNINIQGLNLFTNTTSCPFNVMMFLLLIVNIYIKEDRIREIWLMQHCPPLITNNLTMCLDCSVVFLEVNRAADFKIFHSFLRDVSQTLWEPSACGSRSL